MMNRQQRRRAPKTVAEQCVRAVGWVRAVHAVEWITLWGVYREVVGHDRFKVDDVAEWWGMSRANVYRARQAFIEVYGGEFGRRVTPAIILDMPSNREHLADHKEVAAALVEWDRLKRRQASKEATREVGWMLSPA